MSRLMGESQMGYFQPSGEESRGSGAPREMIRSGGSGMPGWLIAGLALAGLGALVMYYVGPELYRYKRIRDM